MLHKKRQPARIQEIIKLVKQQQPERKDIIKSLKKCSNGKWTSSGYYQFVFASKNTNGPEWKFNETIVLEHQFLGFIVLDILKNGMIAGFEFINLIEEQESEQDR